MTYLPDAPDFIIKPVNWGAAFSQRYDPDNGRAVLPMPVQKLIVHHSASNQPSMDLASEAAFMRALEGYGEARDGAACEYNFLVYPSGRVFGGFGETRGAHCNSVDPSQKRAYNSTAFGICWIGYFHPNVNDTPTDAAIGGFRKLITWLINSGRMTDDVLQHRIGNGQPGWYGHRDVWGTACCGDLLYPMLSDIIKLDNGPPTPPPPPPPVGDDDMPMPCGFIRCNQGITGHHIDGSEYACPVDGTVFRINPGGTIQWVHGGETDSSAAVMTAAGQPTHFWNTDVDDPDVFGRLVGDKPA